MIVKASLISNVIPVYVCKNVKYDVDSTSIVVDLHELVEPKGKWDDDNDYGGFPITLVVR